MKTDVEACRLVSPIVFAVKILKGKKKKIHHISPVVCLPVFLHTSVFCI